MADLEAELDEVYEDGEWEEIEAAESDPPVQASTPAEAARPLRQQRPVDASGETYALRPQSNLDESDQDPSGPSDGDAADTNEDSDVNERVHQASEAVAHLNLEDPPSPRSSASSHSPEHSSATVPPVDIINRRLISGLSAGVNSRSHQPDPSTDRGTARTPSPNGMPSSLNETAIGVEGPLTPRNDAGPFVFDGSAGRLHGVPLENVVATIYDAPTHTSPPQSPSLSASK